MKRKGHRKTHNDRAEHNYRVDHHRDHAGGHTYELGAGGGNEDER